MNQLEKNNLCTDIQTSPAQATDMIPQLQQLVDTLRQQAHIQSQLAEEVLAEMRRQKEEKEKIVLNVILITYNQEKYIRSTLQSILDQRVNFRFNILIADDCSKDNTVSIIREMERETNIPFVYLSNKRNLGIMQNYHRSFAACDAEYVAIMEGDDLWIDPYRLQKHKDFLESHTECVMSFNQFIVKDFEKGTEQIQPVVNHDPTVTYQLFSGHDLAADNIIGNFSTCVYRRLYLQRLPEQLYSVHAYDWLTHIFLSRMGYLGCLLQPMSIYRIHANGVWSQKKQEDKLKELIELTVTYDDLTGHEFSAGFKAQRKRLAAQLVDIQARKNAEGQPVSKHGATSIKQLLKKIIVAFRSAAYVVLDWLPPFIPAVLKFLIPPYLVRRIKNMQVR